MAQNSKYKRCNDNIFLVYTGGAIFAIGEMRDFNFDTRSFMCTAFYWLSIQCTWIMTTVLLFKITFGFQLEIVVVKLWPFASNNYVKSTSLCDLRFLQWCFWRCRSSGKWCCVAGQEKKFLMFWRTIRSHCPSDTASHCTEEWNPQTHTY